MSVPKISILVPVYNVEAYLPRCIDSVLAQDFQDWEMILVDDGSPDRCPQICDEYAAKDVRIRVVHKDNGGLVYARQTGFCESTGEYVMFLDSDDWLENEALYMLYSKVVEGYDIVRGRNYMAFDDGSKRLEEPKLVVGELNSPDEYFSAMINATMSPYLWGAIYRRDLFTADVFERLKPFSIGEDWMTNLSIAKNVHRVCIMDKVVYNYYINRDSMMHQKVCSRAYSDAVEQELNKVFTDAPEWWRDRFAENRMMGMIRNFFCPELGFDKECYRRVREYLTAPEHRKGITIRIQPRYMRFITCELLFRMYSSVYRWLFLHTRQRGVRRKQCDIHGYC